MIVLCVYVLLLRSIQCFENVYIDQELLDQLQTILPTLQPQYSCRNRCGSTIHLYPCACDVRCVVYKNCCEDFNSMCPGVLRQGKETFGHMLDLRVWCDKCSSVLVISSCPNKTVNDVTDPLDVLMNLTYYNIYKFERVSSYFDIVAVFEDLKNVIVTDLSTGLVYANFDYFYCNNGQNSVPVKWDVGFERITKISESHFQLRGMRYLSPGLPKQEINYAICKHDLKETKCNEDPTYKRLCSSYFTFISFGGGTYKNRACVLCGYSISSLSKGMGVPLFLDVPVMARLASSYFDNSSLILSLTSTQRVRTSWSTMVCSIPLTSTHADQYDCYSWDGNFCEELYAKIMTKCRYTSCDSSNSFMMLPGGDCAQENIIYLGLNFHSFYISTGDEKKLLYNISCFVDEVAGIKLTDIFKSAVINDMNNSATAVYVSKFLVYDPTAFISTEITRSGLNVMFSIYLESIRHDNIVMYNNTIEDGAGLYNLSLCGNSTNSDTRLYTKICGAPEKVTVVRESLNACLCTAVTKLTPDTTYDDTVHCELSCYSPSQSMFRYTYRLQFINDTHCYEIFEISSKRSLMVSNLLYIVIFICYQL